MRNLGLISAAGSRHRPSAPMGLREELAAGMAAGLVQDAALHPADTLRARLDVASARHQHGPARALLRELRTVVAADGLLGLYRGYGLCLLGSAPANALYFSTYQATKRTLRGGSAAPSPLLDGTAGLAAEVVAASLWTPLDVLKQRMQVGRSDMHVSDAVREACATDGLRRGLWRGYVAGLCVWGPFSAVYFAAYEAIREGGVGSMLAGVGAGGAAALVTQPLDCAKTRIQVGQAPRSAGLLQVLARVHAREGFGALMRGAAARAMWLAPGCGITITVFERVEAWLRPQPLK